MDSRICCRNPYDMACVDVIHRLCRTKSRLHFEPRLSTEKFTGRNDLPVERCAHSPSHEGFPQASERALVPLRRHAEPSSRRTAARCRPGKLAASKIAAGYHSPVCSSTGDAIDRIAAAIDQLASDARDASGEVSVAELTARVATLWQMVSDLDPELARRARRYTGPADGDPSD